MAEESEEPQENELPIKDVQEDKAASPAAEPTPRNEDPLLSTKVTERDHSFNPTAQVEDPEAEASIDDLFPPEDGDDLILPPPDIPSQGDDKGEAPELKKMSVEDDPNLHFLDPEPPTGIIGASASDFGWEVIQNTLPDVVHELARMDTGDVDKILAKADMRCGEEETAVIEEINGEFKKGLALSDAHNQMGKEAMRQLFVSKGIQKKMTPELMLCIVFVLIIVSWGLAYKRFNRKKKDLFGRLERLVKTQIEAKAPKEAADMTTKD